MPQTPPATNGNGTGSGRLNGWKEIAAYLGRGVRSAQRWERELGLPVRRLDTGGAEVVYALRQELDTWIAGHTRNVRNGQADAEPDAVSNGDSDGTSDRTAPVPPAAEVPARGGRRTVWLLIAAGTLAAVGASLWWSLASPGGPETSLGARHVDLATLEVLGDTLVARGPDRELLWSRSFTPPLEEFRPDIPTGRRNLQTLSAIRDLRHNRAKDVLLARNSQVDRHLYCFDSAGNLRFSHRIDADVRFGSYHCSEIRLSRLFADTDGGSQGTFWVAGHDNLGQFPAVLRHLDALGRRLGEDYWSAGYITAMHAADLGGRRAVLVGSHANETGGAALAVFEGAVGGSSPSANPAYRCAGCPEGGPSRYLIFPRSRLQAELGMAASVGEIAVAADGTVQVTVVTAGVPETDEMVGLAYYRLDRDFRVLSAESGGNFAVIQRRLEAEKLITPATRYRGASDLFPVLRWNGRGYDRVTRPE